jgi:hypothetical protein
VTADWLMLGAGLAAFTFAAGVSDAAAHPARFGQDYQFVAVFGSDGHDFRPNGPVLAALASDPAVAGLTDIWLAATSPSGLGVQPSGGIHSETRSSSITGCSHG